MELLKLIGASFALVLLIFGGLALGLTRQKKVKGADGCSSNDNNDTFHFGCGCGSGACGLPPASK